MGRLGGGMIFGLRRLVASVAWLNFVWVLPQASGDNLRDGRREVVPGRCHGMEGFPRLGSGKCQKGLSLVSVRPGRRRAIAFSNKQAPLYTQPFSRPRPVLARSSCTGTAIGYS